MDRVLSSLGLPAWFRHAYFEYHSHVRLRFKLAAGLGQPWTRDGGIPQGCPLRRCLLLLSTFLGVGILVLNVMSLPNFMLIILSACPGTLACFCRRLDLPLDMFG